MKLKKAFIIAIFILLGFVGRAYSQPYDFNDFVSELGINNTMIDLSLFLNPLDYGYSIADGLIAGNVTVRGLIPDGQVSILNGGGLYQGFQMTAKRLFFYDKIQFQTFATSNNGAIFNVAASTLSFGAGFFNLINSQAAQDGAAIYAASSSIAFRGAGQDLSTVSFVGNMAGYNGGGIGAIDSNISIVSALVDFTANTADYGGGISGRNSKINSANADIRFMRNIAGTDGGAIYAIGASIFNFSNSTVNFSTNTALRGGGLYVKQSNVNFTNSKLSFDGNISLSGGGGAIYAHDSAVLQFISSEIAFTSNTTRDRGGAIYLDSAAQMSFQHGQVSWTSNSANAGGAIYIHSAAAGLTFTNMSVNFFANKALEAGAIYANSSNIAFQNSVVIFDQNSADGTPNDIVLTAAALNLINSQMKMFGGIIARSNSSISQNNGFWFLSGSNELSRMSAFNIQNASMTVSNATFTYFGNSAVFTLSNSTINFTASSVSFFGNSKDISMTRFLFLSDLSKMEISDGLSAADGAFLLDNSVLLLRKNNDFQRINVFELNNSSVSFVNSYTFYRNSKAIHASASTFTFNSSSGSFRDNINGNGTDGGALFARRLSAYFESSSIAFINNKTQNNYSGGAIWMDYGNFHFSNSKIQFTSNTASQEGGAVWADNSSFNFSNAFVAFTSNNALSARGGGAFFIARSTLNFTHGDISFVDNKSGGDGGALFIEDSFASFTNVDAKFRGNRSDNSGGAVYLNRSFMEFNFNDVSFINNAAARGGAFYINASTLSFRNAPNSQMLIDFSNNGVDIEIASADSALIFMVDGGTISLRNALRTQGNELAKIVKQGGGALIFSGQNTRLMNTFNINDGTAIFHSAKSSVSILSLAAQTMLDLRGGGINAVFVQEVSPWDNVWTGFDFDFANKQADFLHILNVNTPLDIQLATVSVSILSNPTFAISSLPFIKAAAFAPSGIDNFFIVDASTKLYSLVLDNGTVWLKYREGWNYFVTKRFQEGQAGTTVYLFNSITAGDDGIPLEFNAPDNVYGDFIVDGRGLVVDSSGTDNLGFVLVAANLEFRDIHFTSFVRIASEGAIFSATKSHIDFISETSAITFANSIAPIGGAIYITNSSTVSFHGGSVIFENNNSSSQNGGAINATMNAMINFNVDNVVFSNNSAGKQGGAISLNRHIIVNFNVDNVVFSNNSADGSGGAIFAYYSQINLDGGAFVFENNTSQSQGGAFYLSASTLNFNAQGGTLDVYFKDNFAGGVSNDIYVNADADADIDKRSIFFNSGNGTINFSNGIRIEVEDGGAPIFKTGYGTVIFDGLSYMKNDLEILQGRAIFKGAAKIDGEMNIKPLAAAVFETTISSVSSVNAESGSTLSMLGGGFGELWISSITLINASLVLDIDFSRPVADRIFTSSVSIEATSLIINEINRNLWVRQSSIAIIFADSPFYAELLFNESQFRLYHYDNMAVLQYVGFNPNVYDALLKTALTHNQRESALMLKRIRNTKEGVDLTESVLIKGSPQHIRRQLDILSASFLAASIIQATQRDSRDKLYPLINPLDEKRNSNAAFIYENFWVLASFDGIKLNNKGNEIDWFKGFSREIAGGYNFIANDELMMGGFINAGSEKLRQDENRADIDNFEIGFYGGVFIPKIETRFFLTVGHHDIATERRLDMLGVSKTKADFELTTIKAGIESAYDDFEIVKPYAGLRWAVVYNEQVRESNYSQNQKEAMSALGISDDATVNAAIDRGAYQRLRGYAGLKHEKYLGKVLWHVKGELGYMFIGNGTDSEYEIHLADLGQNMDIWGLDVDPFVYGLGGGFEMPIRKNVEIFTNAGFLRSLSADLTQVNVNVGAKFYFGKRIIKESAIIEDEELSDIDEARGRRARALEAYKLKAASFDFGSSVLSQEAKGNVARIAREINRNSYRRITVEGHTDSVGTFEVNMAISTQRAQAVADELIANGVDKEKVKVIGFAFNMPTADNETAAGRMENRRVEIFVE